MGHGSGFGKTILFNEHFVVYGIPGVVSAIELTASAEVRRTEKGINIKDERKGAIGYTQKKLTQQKDSISRILKALGLEPELASLEILLGGELPGFSGIGASAASSVAIVRAIVDEYNLGLSKERINGVAYEAEKAYAGNPSGIDNTAATYGGLIWFRKSVIGRSNTIEKLSLRKPVEIIIGNTGIVADTKAMVEGVAARKKRNPVKFDQLFRQAEDLAFKARINLIDFNLRKVGVLMNENHQLLQEINVSCEELDYLVNLAREKGAYGAKLTGGGGGGCMVALTPGKKLQEEIATTMKNEGFQVLKTRIGI
ncbi:MAG: mevalonate kinase [Candidatus Bathyarchaeota archaeon]|nr:MAG: mevalonate kinase [Candidatus Bathyarchaeota archaeon]